MQLLKALYMKGLSLNNVKKFTYLYNTSHSKGFRELLTLKSKLGRSYKNFESTFYLQYKFL